MEEIIRVQGLCKSYGDFQAVNDLSFSVLPGEVYGFLGQNGAGKSTTIRMLLTLIKPTSGRIEIMGKDLTRFRNEILKQVGAVVERPDLYKYLSAYENLRIFALMSGVSPSKELLMKQLEQVGLADRARDKVKTFSQGMKQRLGLAVALIHDPQLIILDEPTNGLDPQGIADVRNLILHLSRHHKKTIMVSSHLLSEIELIADRMLIIDRGRKIVEGAVQELFDPKQMLVEAEILNEAEIMEALMRSEWATHFKNKRKGLLTFQFDREEVPRFTQALVGMGARVMSVQPKHSLESYFLSLTTANQHVDDFKN